MENLANISSEEELLQLRNEGKISKDEYEELRDAMQKSTKIDVEPPTAAAPKAKSKRKLGKIAFYLMLLGIVLPVICWVLDYRLAAPIIPAPQTGANRVAPTGYGGPGLWRFFLPAFILVETVAFVMGVIAWPDVFAKATVVTISSIVVLAFLFMIAVIVF